MGTQKHMQGEEQIPSIAHNQLHGGSAALAITQILQFQIIIKWNEKREEKTSRSSYIVKGSLNIKKQPERQIMNRVNMPDMPEHDN